MNEKAESPALPPSKDFIIRRAASFTNPDIFNKNSPRNDDGLSSPLAVYTFVQNTFSPVIVRLFFRSSSNDVCRPATKTIDLGLESVARVWRPLVCDSFSLERGGSGQLLAFSPGLFVGQEGAVRAAHELCLQELCRFLSGTGRWRWRVEEEEVS